jgi:4-amino-4-deoxy-L-arabinose transferase-like glycosyltransferase
MLTKGPIAYAFLLPGLLAFWFIRWRAHQSNDAWAGWWPWFAPLLIFGAWAGIGIWQSREFYVQVVEVEFLGRFTVGEKAVHHNQPIYFYLANMIGKFAPWSLWLIALHFQKRVRAAIASDPARLWLICWALGGLAFMSLVPSKRADRIFPVIPPLCLLTAATLTPLADLRIWRFSGRGLGECTAALALLITLTASIVEIARGYRDHQDDLARFGKAARAAAAEHPERLAIVSGKDEGMLLYAQRPAFTKLDDAIAGWQRGEIDWLVLGEKDFTKRGHDFAPARTLATVPHLPEKFSGYVLLQRAANP